MLGAPFLSRQIEFVENPHRIFTKLVYNDETTDYTTPFLDLSKYKNTYVKVIVEKKSKPIVFDRLLELLNEAGCHSFTVDDRVANDKIKTEQKVDLTKDTLTLICEEIDTMTGVPDPTRLTNLVRDLYMEALLV